MARAAVVGLALVVLTSSLRAEERHLDLVRALRANGMADLAVDYLERLGKNPPANLKAILPLELAKARLDLAVYEGNDRKRNKQFEAAKQAYDDFLQANPNHPLAAEARLDLARLTTLQGKQLLAQARRTDDKAARRDLVARARPLFGEAAAKLSEATKAIDAKMRQLAEPSNDDEKALRESLVRAKGQARLETAINKLNQAMAMSDGSATEIKDRAKVVRSAQDDLSAIYADERDSAFGWLARVWAGRCYEELDDKPNAVRLYEQAAKEEKPVAAEAARLAQFRLHLMKFKDVAVLKRVEAVKDVVDGCEKWLKDHAAATDTAEGQGVRFLLASALEEQVQSGIIRDAKGAAIRVTPAARPVFVRIERLLKSLADGENEFTERAHAKRASILVALMAERAGGPVANLQTFEECYLAAQVEAWEATQSGKPDAEKARRYAKAIAALNRGLGLAGRSDAPRDLADARVMLTYAHLVSGDPYAAAVLGEWMGRSHSAGPRGAEATAYALQAYSAIIADDRRRAADENELKADQRRLRTLAEYMEKTWPDEPVTDYARHQLATFLEQDGNVVEALAMLARISPTYPGLAAARFLQGTSTQRAQSRDVKLPEDQKKKLLAQAIADLEKLPEPVPGASEESTIASSMAKLQLGNLLLIAGEDAKAEALGKRMADLTPKLSLEKSLVPQVALEAAKVQLAGALGRAAKLFQADKADAGAKALAPLYERVRAELTGKPPEAATESWYAPYREVQVQVLMLALRVAIEANRPGDAQTALGLVEMAAKGAGNLGVSTNDRLLRVVFDLKKEAEASKAKGESDKREKLEKGLTSFLDEMAKPKDLPGNVRAFLAQAYASLERHDRAAEVLAAIPQPKGDDEDAKRFYQYARMTLAKEYRLAKQFDKAAAVLTEILKDWGKTNLDVRAEKVFLYEDRPNLPAAVKECRDIQAALAKPRAEFDKAVRDERLADDELRKAKTDSEREAAQAKLATAQQAKASAQPMRDRYWQFYFYELRIVLKSGNLQKDPAAKEKRIADVAGAIRKFEDGQDDFGGGDLKQKFIEMLDGDPLLKRKYAEAGGTKLLAR
ncbi:MAG: hypothetical protein U0746_18625 [Gemmataceae bacterium]